MTLEVTLALVAVITLLSGQVLLRAKTAAKYEVKVLDVVIALVPVGVWLLVSGKLLEFGVGDFKLKLQELSKKPVAGEISQIREGKAALLVGVDCTYGSEDNILKPETFPNYIKSGFILIMHSCKDDDRGEDDAKLYALLSIQDFKDVFYAEHSKVNADYFLSLVKSEKLAEFAKGNIPSFVDKANAVTPETTKLEALRRMEKLNVEALPVIDSSGAYLGVIMRSRLVSSTLLELAEAAK